MKTTIDIADDLLDEARQVARKDRVTLRELVMDGLRYELEKRRHQGRVEIEPYVITGEALTEDLTWEQMREVLEEDELERFKRFYRRT